MKRSLTLLLASLLLVCSLTACGGKDKQDTNQNNSAVTGSDTANENGAAADDRTDTNGANGNGTGSLMQDAEDAVTDGVDDVRDGIDDVGDALTGDHDQNSTANQNGTTNQTRSAGGVTYGQMLRNGRVHDTDGILTDGENSVTRGTMF